MEKERLKASAAMPDAGADDYCDLDPAKLCDNCCKCLDLEKKKFNTIEVEFADRIDAFDAVALPFDESVFGEAEDEDGFDPSRVQPLEIDPKLLAEWEAKLAALERQEREASAEDEEEVAHAHHHDGCDCGCCDGHERHAH